MAERSDQLGPVLHGPHFRRRIPEDDQQMPGARNTRAESRRGPAKSREEGMHAEGGEAEGRETGTRSRGRGSGGHACRRWGGGGTKQGYREQRREGEKKGQGETRGVGRERRGRGEKTQARGMTASPEFGKEGMQRGPEHGMWAHLPEGEALEVAHGRLLWLIESHAEAPALAAAHVCCSATRFLVPHDAGTSARHLGLHATRGSSRHGCQRPSAFVLAPARPATAGPVPFTCISSAGAMDREMKGTPTKSLSLAVHCPHRIKQVRASTGSSSKKGTPCPVHRDRARRRQGREGQGRAHPRLTLKDTRRSLQPASAGRARHSARGCTAREKTATACVHASTSATVPAAGPRATRLGAMLFRRMTCGIPREQKHAVHEQLSIALALDVQKSSEANPIGAGEN